MTLFDIYYNHLNSLLKYAGYFDFQPTCEKTILYIVFLKF